MESNAVVGKFGKQARLHEIRKVERAKKTSAKVTTLPWGCLMERMCVCVCVRFVKQEFSLA